MVDIDDDDIYDTISEFKSVIIRRYLIPNIQYNLSLRDNIGRGVIDI